MEAPRITHYARIIDNVTDKIVLDFSNNTNNTWYYGKCSADGESEYVVEFDIWNNEPAFDAHTRQSEVSAAKNCRMTVWLDSECKVKDNPLFNLPKPFMYGKCTTSGFEHDYNNYQGYPISNDQFIGMRHDTLMLKDITGNANISRIGTIQGNGDHAYVQTKIILPQDCLLPPQRYGFVLGFYYDFE